MNTEQVIATDPPVQPPQLTPELVTAVLAELEAAHLDGPYTHEHVRAHLARNGCDLVAGHLATLAMRQHSWRELLALCTKAAEEVAIGLDIDASLAIAKTRGLTAYLGSPSFAAHDELTREQALEETYKAIPADAAVAGLLVWREVAIATYHLQNNDASGAEQSRTVTFMVRDVATALHNVAPLLADSFLGELRALAEN